MHLPADVLIGRIVGTRATSGRGLPGAIGGCDENAITSPELDGLDPVRRWPDRRIRRACSYPARTAQADPMVVPYRSARCWPSSVSRGWGMRTMRARWGSMFLVAGACCCVIIGITMSSAGAFIPGLLILLVGLARGAGDAKSLPRGGSDDGSTLARLRHGWGLCSFPHWCRRGPVGDRQPRMRLSPLKTGCMGNACAIPHRTTRESPRGDYAPMAGSRATRTRMCVSAVECIDLASGCCGSEPDWKGAAMMHPDCAARGLPP